MGSQLIALRSAVLTKYTALASYHEWTNGKELVNYDSAESYMDRLLDDYFQYKYIWKQIETGECLFLLGKRYN